MTQEHFGAWLEGETQLSTDVLLQDACRSAERTDKRFQSLKKEAFTHPTVLSSCAPLYGRYEGDHDPKCLG